MHQQICSPLWLLLCSFFYACFTLLPDSHSLIVSWPWVLVWQIALFIPLLWWINQLWTTWILPSLGLGLNSLFIFLFISFLISAAAADYHGQAIWYTFAAFAYSVIPYTLVGYMQTSQQRLNLLTQQGYLALGFIVVSLGLWFTQTYLPELERLRSLQTSDVNLFYNFSVIELRNWAPLGHQNYVAGYLLLILPLFVALTIIHHYRLPWLLGIVMGCLDLYTTSSRAGWIGLATIFFMGFAICIPFTRRLRQQLYSLGLGSIGILLLILFSNNRLVTLSRNLFQGNVDGELAFRLVTVTTGWWIGVTHWLVGSGLGSVPLVYQQYRPHWAGRSAEMVFQLHSTPAQIWAELGMLGIGLMIMSTVLLVSFTIRWLTELRHEINCLTLNPSPVTLIKNGPLRRNNPLWSPFNIGAKQSEFHIHQHIEPEYDQISSDTVLTGGVLCGFFAYVPMALTDFQLDNPAIAVVCGVFVAYLGAVFGGQSLQISSQVSRNLGGIAAGIILIMIFWLWPVHRAWQLSSQAFMQLQTEPPNFQSYQHQLSLASHLAPWEPYYPLQLGWQLGELTRTQPALRSKALESLTGANLPVQEFSYSNLGWLQLQSNPVAAANSFAHAAKLVPAKQGAFWSLGLSLLQQGKSNLAIDAFVLELIRDPIGITSPQWQTSELRTLYPAIMERLKRLYIQLEQKATSQSTQRHLHQGLALFYWWQQEFDSALAVIPLPEYVLQQALVKVSNQQFSLEQARLLTESAIKYVILAWLQPDQRAQLLDKAWVMANKTEPIPAVQAHLLQGMETSRTFYQWLSQYPSTHQFRRERLGFGVLSRHIDGPRPKDFILISENIPMVRLLSEILPKVDYVPELDNLLESHRQLLITAAIVQ